MPSVWDMMDLLNIPDCKVTAFPGNSANFSFKKNEQEVVDNGKHLVIDGFVSTISGFLLRFYSPDYKLFIR